MLTAEEIRELRRAGKSVREIARQEGVSISAIYGCIERDERPWLDKARKKRYHVRHRERHRELKRKFDAALKRKNQNATVDTAVNSRQYWTTGEIKELEDRVRRGETVVVIALAMGRTFKGIGRALNRFGISMRRTELTAR